MRNPDHIAIDAHSQAILRALLEENPRLRDILVRSSSQEEAMGRIRQWMEEERERRPAVRQFLEGRRMSRQSVDALGWEDMAVVRILDYVANAGRTFADMNEDGKEAESNPFAWMWLAVHHGTGGTSPAFFADMRALFAQLRGALQPVSVTRERLDGWMAAHPSGLDPHIVELRRENRDRIIRFIVKLIDKGKGDRRYHFPAGLSAEQKYLQVEKWWNESVFHLRFAARDPETLDAMLGHSLSQDTMRLLRRAKKAGIPFFVNPYYASLLLVRGTVDAVGADLAIRDYVLYSPQLVETFGKIHAWEKEDIIEDGKPNAAGWLLPPGRNVHRRYPNVAVVIPNTRGRACGGLCTSCQRMYRFQQAAEETFDTDALAPPRSWQSQLGVIMEYFRNDAQLRDVLITGGDALMSTNASLQRILDAVLDMARAKARDNAARPDGAKYAQIQRIRLGTRLLSYLPQRVDDELVDILAAFRERAVEAGMSQFIVQVHFESAMEVTPEAVRAIGALQKAGWVVANQHVFIAASSRRGHVAKLRSVLSQLGVLPYYTFSVKGFRENAHLAVPISRLLQEARQEKAFGRVRGRAKDMVLRLHDEPNRAAALCAEACAAAKVPFLATDRSIMNLPAVGKSLTFRVVGLTRDGRRVLEFEYDTDRAHSPVIRQMGKFRFVETKSVAEYLRQIEEMGEDPGLYADVYGYTVGHTEKVFPVFRYPEYPFAVTEELTNFVPVAS